MRRGTKPPKKAVAKMQTAYKIKTEELIYNNLAEILSYDLGWGAD
jgi:hypothetical protein